MRLFRALLAPLVLLLPACAGSQAGLSLGEWQWPFQAAGGHAGKQSGHAPSAGTFREFSFAWELAGDPHVMPVQVFDDGERMWLQFPPEGAVPAIFESGPQGLRPLEYRREPPYLVLDAVHEQLELRGGHLRGSIRRAPRAVSADGSQAGPVAPATVVVTALAESASEPLSGAAPPRVMATPDAPAQPAQAASRVPGTEAGPSVPYLGSPVHRYAVSPADQTIRQALERWARMANWTFSAEHWAVDVDIPLVGNATFDADFKAAVRELLAATEMGDRPLQPCFYSNQVLRVVPHAQACDRSAGTRAVS